MNDPVNNPAHYKSHPSGVECITITRHMTFNIGNAVKYLWRNGLKGGEPSVRDLQKAIWYIQDEINAIERRQENDNQHSLALETASDKYRCGNGSENCGIGKHDICAGCEDDAASGRIAHG